MMTSRFISAFQEAFESGALIKCTLSKPAAAAPADLKNMYLRPVALKSGLKVAFNYRYKTRDEVKNFDLPDTLAQLEHLLGTAFLNADLFTTQKDYTLSFDKKGAPFLSEKKAAQTAAVNTQHNRDKQRLLDPAAPWLHALGITGARGDVLPSAQDK